MERSIEQCYSIKFCVGLRKSPIETLVMIQKMFTIIPSPKKDSNEQVEGQSHAHCLPCRQGGPALWTSISMYPRDTPSRVLSTYKSWKDWREGSVEWVQALLQIGNCIMTMHQAWFVVKDYMARNDIVTLPQPLYSPIRLRRTLSCSPRVKITLQGYRHGTVAEVKATSASCLKDVPGRVFQGAFQT